ncbi:MAG: single-stranded-DNA-specific exonuclease RecJ, partial [Proteobacteria bacterium]|nr:single-stranded-DNA-specific exonuclease RecJ [Pseudomonadota bacterium]
MYSQGVKKTIVLRPVEKATSQFDDIHPLLQRIFSARGVKSTDDLDRTLDKLPSPWLLSGMENMEGHLIDAIKNQQKITI